MSHTVWRHNLPGKRFAFHFTRTRATYGRYSQQYCIEKMYTNEYTWKNCLEKIIYRIIDIFVDYVVKIPHLFVPVCLKFVRTCLIGWNTLYKIKSSSVKEIANVWKKLDSWNFPIFKFQQTTRHPLADMGLYLFKDIGLVEHYKLPGLKLRNFLLMLNEGKSYSSNVSFHHPKTLS